MLESKSRVEGISDAIFGFAATLVVVSLEVPDDFTELVANPGRFLSFAISFFALVLVWRAHYAFFRRTDRIDGWIVALNFGMLFVVLYFVYPLKFLANLTTGQATIGGLGELADLFILYSSGLASIFFFLALMYRRSARGGPPARRPELRFWSRHFALFVVVGLVSIGLAAAGIGLWFGAPGVVYFLLGPACFWHGQKYFPKPVNN